MKASLVSATSLMALLAFEVGIDAAIDVPQANAATFTASPNTLSFGYVLLNSTIGTTAITETVTNATSSKNTITLPGVTSISSSPFFSGTQTVVTLSNTTGPNVTAKNVYKFTPTVTGSWTNSIKIVGGGSTTVTVGMSGTAVAPVQSTTVSAFGAVRIGTTATIAAITVSNKGDGDLASNTASMAQLQGSLGAPSSSVFTGSTHTFSLNDAHYTGSGTATISAAYSYTYAPTAHTTSDSATVVASFTNGSSAGTNKAQTTSLTLSGSGVGPEYESKINGTTYTNSTAIGHSTINVGTISTGAYKPGKTATLQITLANISTDSGSASLTDLTLESFALSGADASDFSVIGFTADTVLAEAASVVVTLDFSGTTVGAYNADLEFTTDQGVALGAAGTVFNYALSANISEPATIVTLGAGLAGLTFARRRRKGAAQRTAISA
jgi:hypothetical protein